MIYNKDLVPNPDYKGITKEQVEKAFNEIFHVPQRRVKMYTGVGGYDRYIEVGENYLGYKRIYIGKKVLRIIKSLNFAIKKSPRGIYYKLIRK